ncbi:MAG TPA: CPBP family intramembrane glutamic endopeptidase [Phycisphaerales bacterium]|nr:CPBP family intramembrane glutamic endopeptidase [Phycisphaerales bacterium]
MFGAGPLLFALFARGERWLFPALWLWAGVCLLVLLTDRTFERRRLWSTRGLRRELRPMLARFAVLGLGITALVLAITPREAFGLPRRDPTLWAAIMVLYPLVSVYPQEVIFRAFFFHRYAGLLRGRWAMIGASAVAFGWAHIVFQNAVSIPMTLIGGALFSLTYERSRSVFAASVEHALYGCLVFTVGLGHYFYDGSARRDAPPAHVEVSDQ